MALDYNSSIGRFNGNQPGNMQSIRQMLSGLFNGGSQGGMGGLLQALRQNKSQYPNLGYSQPGSQQLNTIPTGWQMQPKSSYGTYMNLQPGQSALMNFVDSDGDKIDDRYQAGPGMSKGQIASGGNSAYVPYDPNRRGPIPSDTIPGGWEGFEGGSQTPYRAPNTSYPASNPGLTLDDLNAAGTAHLGSIPNQNPLGNIGSRLDKGKSLSGRAERRLNKMGYDDNQIYQATQAGGGKAGFQSALGGMDRTVAAPARQINYNYGGR